MKIKDRTLFAIPLIITFAFGAFSPLPALASSNDQLLASLEQQIALMIDQINKELEGPYQHYEAGENAFITENFNNFLEIAYTLANNNLAIIEDGYLTLPGQ